MPAEDLSRYLPGVADVHVAALVGPANSFPQQRRRMSFSKANMREMISCGNKCHGGGFELVRDLYDRAVRAQKPEAAAVIRCRGYENMGRGRRQACDWTLVYKASVKYGADYF